jgi:methylated-DNA-[protein]-cysteine S-methyltransferase
MILNYQKLKTTFGPLHVYADEQKLWGIFFPQNHDANIKWGRETLDLVKKSNKIIDLLSKQLEQYAAGRRTDFEIPMLLQGTEFQLAAWKTLMKIPFGKTLSYAEQAKALGKTKAVRAVGSANGRNRFPILIPCHRVIASDKSLGGYAGGLALKKKLLALELFGKINRKVPSSK